MNGAFAGCGPGHILPVLSAAAKVKAKFMLPLPMRVYLMITPSRSNPYSLPTNCYPILAMLLMIGHNANETLEATQVLNPLNLMTRIFPSTLMGGNVSLK